MAPCGTSQTADQPRLLSVHWAVQLDPHPPQPIKINSASSDISVTQSLETEQSLLPESFDAMILQNSFWTPVWYPTDQFHFLKPWLWSGYHHQCQPPGEKRLNNVKEWVCSGQKGTNRVQHKGTRCNMKAPSGASGVANTPESCFYSKTEAGSQDVHSAVRRTQIHHARCSNHFIEVPSAQTSNFMFYHSGSSHTCPYPFKIIQFQDDTVAVVAVHHNWNHIPITFQCGLKLQTRNQLWSWVHKP